MCNKFLKLEYTAHKKSSYALCMIMSEIGLHSFSTYIQLSYLIVIFVHEVRQAISCENNKIMDHQTLHLFVFFTNCKF